MKTAAIICEYNPFHNGHKYQLDAARKACGCEAIVALMSGNYVQRGSFAVFPKEIRAKAALQSGVDLVLENPAYCTLRSAELYASASVYTLSALNCADYLVFGAEHNNLDDLFHIASLLSNETDKFKQILNDKLKSGASFASARSYAVGSVMGCDFEEVLKQPNNLLAIEYIKAIIRQKSNLKPVLIKRIGTAHNDMHTNNEYASASLLREKLLNDADVSGFIPENLEELYKSTIPFNPAASDLAILTSLCLKSADELADCPDISEGLENKIKSELYSSDTLDALISSVKSKRYAYSRIRRSLLCGYLGLRKADISRKPEYIKILDFNDRGQAVLNTAKKTAMLPLAKNAAPLLKNESAMTLWKRELDFDRVYEILYSAGK